METGGKCFRRQLFEDREVLLLRPPRPGSPTAITTTMPSAACDVADPSGCW